jgi:hypothetical protein
MLYLIFGLLVLAALFGPNLWVRYVLDKYSKPLDGVPGTGGELAEHLIKRFDLDGVTVEQAQDAGDHYDPQDKAVRLSPRVFAGKSLTAVAIAAHEVGHAIQFVRDEPVSHLRKRYLGKVRLIQQVGMVIVVALPTIAGALQSPRLALLAVAAGVAVMLLSVLMYVAVLPEEFDASFNKALPILDEGDYVPKEYLPIIRRILRAAALTYVAAALLDMLRLWRWIRYWR